MGYDVHITRKQNWFDDDGPEITLQEWLDVAHSDPEMRVDGYAEARTSDGSVIRTNDASMSVWVAYPQNGINGATAWLWHSNGNVMAKNPDQDILRKMWSLAERLDALVQGDEGEFYGPDGSAAAEAIQDSDEKPKKKSWWKW